jgi:hypothetical protein
MYFRFFTHIIGFLINMMTINFDTITNNYEVIYVIKTVMKYYFKKIDASFHQRFPNMVQKTNVYGINRYFFVLIWNIAGFSTRDRNCLCLSTRSAALHSWKDIQCLSLVEDPHSQKSWVILLMNIHKPNRVMYDVSK